MDAYDAEIATNRFGLGARAGEIAAARADPRSWLLAQLQPLAFDAAAGDSAQAISLTADLRHAKASARTAGTPKQPRGGSKSAGATRRQEQVALQKLSDTLVNDTLLAAVRSDRPFAMRLFDFFSNHFSVSMTGAPMRALAPTLEREAIAPHVAGRFEDMLLAVERHPAMLLYLNNAQSVGPDSRFGVQQKRGLNENLAREILELHTLGVDGGYHQADVRELAQAITGWTLGNPERDEASAFRFRGEMHQPGTRTVLGQRYAQDGLEQGEQILRALAMHPATARHVCFKLARHVVADQPPQELIDAMTATWKPSGGDLRAVTETLVRHDRSWELPARKLKSPREFVVSAARAVGGARINPRILTLALKDLGHAPFNAGSPAGFGDVSSAWDGADALLTRVDWAEQRLGTRRSRAGEPLDLARDALGGLLQERTVSALRNAASREQALALLLMSPEFQRR